MWLAHPTIRHITFRFHLIKPKNRERYHDSVDISERMGYLWISNMMTPAYDTFVRIYLINIKYLPGSQIPPCARRVVGWTEHKSGHSFRGWNSEMETMNFMSTCNLSFYFCRPTAAIIQRGPAVFIAVKDFHCCYDFYLRARSMACSTGFSHSHASGYKQPISKLFLMKKAT